MFYVLLKYGFTFFLILTVEADVLWLEDWLLVLVSYPTKEFITLDCKVFDLVKGALLEFVLILLLFMFCACLISCLFRYYYIRL